MLNFLIFFFFLIKSASSAIYVVRLKALVVSCYKPPVSIYIHTHIYCSCFVEDIILYQKFINFLSFFSLSYQISWQCNIRMRLKTLVVSCYKPPSLQEAVKKPLSFRHIVTQPPLQENPSNCDPILGTRFTFVYPSVVACPFS